MSETHKGECVLNLLRKKGKNYFKIIFQGSICIIPSAAS